MRLSSGAGVWAALLLVAAVQDVEKTPLPSDADQAQALKLIKDVFKAEFAKSSPADKRLLSRKMLEQSRETKDDPTTKYVLLREGRELANQAGDLPLAIEAIEEMAKVFAVDAGPLRLGALTAATRTARTPEDCQAIVQAAFKTSEGAIAKDDYDTADKVLATASQMARKAQDAALASRAGVKAKEAVDLRSKFAAVKKARETLAANPEDPAANALVGRYLSIQKGAWSEGLPFLAKGSDETLRGIAMADLADPPEAAAQASVGDAWWELADKETASKELLRDRAALWYGKAVAKLSGLGKTKTEKRLTEVNTVRLAKGNWLSVTDPKLFNRPGKPGETIEIRGTPGYQTHTMAKEFPKGEFDGITVHLTLDPAAKTKAYLYLESDSISAFVDTGSSMFGFATRQNGTLPWSPAFQEKCEHPEECTLTVLLVGGEYILYLDNLEKARQKAKATSFKVLTLNNYYGNVTMERFKLRRME